MSTCRQQIKRLVWTDLMVPSLGPPRRWSALMLCVSFGRSRSLDFRSFHSFNGSSWCCCIKLKHPIGLKDYMPISLIYFIGKLFVKGLTLRLVPRMPQIVKDKQSAFIQGCKIHKNFRTMLLACCWLHARRCPMILIKVDLTKAFNTVACPFL